jgi:hypothetical protein
VTDDAVPDLRRTPPWWLARPSDGLVFSVYARAYGVATLLRLTLPDAMQWSWLPVSILWGAGAIVLLANGSLLGWLLCATGALSAIVALQDQLTQSAYLLACAIAAMAWIAGPSHDRDARVERGLPATVRVLTVLVYLLAGFHKLNADFLDPAVSCANGGLRALASHGQQGSLLPDAWLTHPAWPRIFLALELGLPALALWRPGYAVVAMAAFHLPLTIIFAPGFAFTMMSGWICLLGEARLRALGRTLRSRWTIVVMAGLVPAAVSAVLFFPGRWRTDPDWRLKEVLLWCVFVALAWTAASQRASFGGRDVWKASNRRRAGALPITALLAGLFVLHGLTPYLGLGFHRTGAMLSNLRIDDGCDNHLIMPPSLRLSDPYVRVEDIHFAPGRAAPGFEDEVKGRLWSSTALWRARDHWCSKHAEPLPVTLIHHGARRVIADFCAPAGWPWPRPWLPGMRRFQVNLTTSCPQACVH